MRHVNPDPETLRALLIDARTIAVVGASPRPDRPSHGVMRKLLAAGYRVIPVNPLEREVLGQKSFPSLLAVDEPVDIVDVFRRAEHTPPIADEAVAIGARVLWLQQGVVSQEAAARARAGGLTVVMDACIAVEHALLQVPRKT
jgi:predicted CoA-binding protein